MNDVVNVGDSSKLLNSVLGLLEIFGETGSDFINLDDSGDTIKQ